MNSSFYGVHEFQFAMVSKNLSLSPPAPLNMILLLLFGSIFYIFCTHFSGDGTNANFYRVSNENFWRHADLHPINTGLCPPFVSFQIGDSGVGKTSVIMTYVDGAYPREGVPGKFPSCSVLVTLDDEQVTLLPADTNGRKEYIQDRTLAYKDSGVIILCYDIMNRPSFDNIKKKWIAELDKYAPTVPIILVGTKVEARMASERSQCELQQHAL